MSERHFLQVFKAKWKGWGRFFFLVHTAHKTGEREPQSYSAEIKVSHLSTNISTNYFLKEEISDKRCEKSHCHSQSSQKLGGNSMGSTCLGQYENWCGTFQVPKIFVKSKSAHQTC